MAQATPTTIAEAWELEAQRMPSAYTDAERRLARSWYYMGALAAVVSPTHSDDLLRELIAYGRTIGTAVERAS